MKKYYVEDLMCELTKYNNRELARKVNCYDIQSYFVNADEVLASMKEVRIAFVKKIDVIIRLLGTSPFVPENNIEELIGILRDAQQLKQNLHKPGVANPWPKLSEYEAQVCPILINGLRYSKNPENAQVFAALSEMFIDVLY